MTLTLKHTAGYFAFSDEKSGYEFGVETSFDPEYGWCASLSLQVRGRKEEMDSVKDLVLPLRHALRLVEELLPKAEKPAPTPSRPRPS